MSLLNFEETLSSINGKFIGLEKNKANFSFTSVATDSRNVVKGSLFVPLIGSVQNGHKYVPQAIESGATVIFIANIELNNNLEKYSELSKKYENVCIFAVENTLSALQDAARAYVEKFPNLIKVGITGSSGKTTTKEMIVSVLKQKYNVVYTKGNFNSETGLPLSVFNIRPENEVGVFEMGMNRKNEIGEIASVLKPKYAVVTNIGTAHIGILGSRKNIAEEKRKIFNYIPKDGIAFIPAEDDFKDFLSENIVGKIVYFGNSVSEKISGVKFIKDLGLLGTEFSLDGIEIHLKNPGVYNYRNALCACAVGKALGLSAVQIKNGLENVSSVNGRMEILKIALKTNVNVTLIKDCYNANPDSMQSVLSFCSTLGSGENSEQVAKSDKSEGNAKSDKSEENAKSDKSDKIYILGDMLELGEKSKEEHEKVLQKAVESKPRLIVLVGKEMESGFAFAKKLGFKNIKYFPNSDENSINEVGKEVLSCAKNEDVILIKASRGIALERVIPVISKNAKEEN